MEKDKMDDTDFIDPTLKTCENLKYRTIFHHRGWNIIKFGCEVKKLVVWVQTQWFPWRGCKFVFAGLGDALLWVPASTPKSTLDSPGINFCVLSQFILSPPPRASQMCTSLSLETEGKDNVFVFEFFIFWETIKNKIISYLLRNFLLILSM